jgi:hypothetical protein
MSITTKIADGTFIRDGALNSIYNNAAGGAPDINLPPIFQRWVVLDVIFDPYIIDEDKIHRLESIHGTITNAKYALDTQPPRNTIIAKQVIDSRRGNKTMADNAMLLYPMFPSSLSMPCKPGEHVWVMFEFLTEQKNLGYWICSIVGPGHIEDVNHSHFPRSFDSTFLAREENADAKSQHENKSRKPRYHFKNGIYAKVNVLSEDSVIDPASATLSGGDDAYERILTETDAAKASVYESVPRFKKRPGDIALEGSNNTLIVLGRDRTGSAATYTTIDTTNITSPNPNGPKRVDDTANDSFTKKGAGSIDIVAGRGQTPKTGGSKVINQLQNQELAKDKKSISLNEGDPDFKNDRSRIYISQNTNVDNSLGEDYVKKNLSRNPSIKDSVNGDAGIIIKSDKVRIFARSDVQILVTGFTEDVSEESIAESELSVQDKSSNIDNTQIASSTIKNEKSDSKKWASITIKSNGDIVFEPSDLGYIKLGGEDANKGIVCTTQPVIATNGGVFGNPLLTTDGGQIAGAAAPSPQGNKPALPQTPQLDLGTYANKVLVK